MDEDLHNALINLLTPDKWLEAGNGCWVWTKGTSKGYGKITARRNGRSITRTAHRVSLAKKLRRPIRDSYLACHTCDNPLCVNPEHLYEGTPKDNTQDMLRRGRRNNSHLLGGEATRKLTTEQVVEIRDRASRGEYNAGIAKDFGVSLQTISNAVTGKLYGFKGEDARGHNAEKWKHRAPRSLTDVQVREIRTRYASGEKQKALEEEFSLGGGTVSRIVNRKLYKDVEEDA